MVIHLVVLSRSSGNLGVVGLGWLGITVFVDNSNLSGSPVVPECRWLRGTHRVPPQGAESIRYTLLGSYPVFLRLIPGGQVWIGFPFFFLSFTLVQTCMGGQGGLFGLGPAEISI